MVVEVQGLVDEQLDVYVVQWYMVYFKGETICKWGVILLQAVLGGSKEQVLV